MVVTTSGPAAAAAVFTPNTFAAAPVRQSRAHLAATSGDPRGGFGWAEAVISTSGAPTPRPAPRATPTSAAIAQLLADATGVPVERTLHLSTGVIGTRLPLDKVEAGLAALVPTLDASDAGFEAAAVALRTTNSVTKLATTTVELPGRRRPAGDGDRQRHRQGRRDDPPEHGHDALDRADRCGGRARRSCGRCCGPAAARTWDQLSVDGDTSTNDTVFVLASGASGAAPVRSGSAEAAVLGAAIEAVGRDLARQQAADGEGATTLITAVGHRCRRRCECPGRGAARSSARAWSRRRPTAATPTGAGSRARPATRGWPMRAVLEAAGLSAARGHGPCRHPGRARPRTACASRSPGHLVFDGTGRRPGRLRSRGGARRDGRPRAGDRPGPRPRRGGRARPSAAT